VDGRLLGAMDLAVHAESPASLAYWLARDVRGRGVAPRAMRLLPGWAVDAFRDLVRVELSSILGPPGLRRRAAAA
jgi:RimJ/RimL family protein N-acetyltransferase